jgi:hypothetical protein
MLVLQVQDTGPSGHAVGGIVLDTLYAKIVCPNPAQGLHVCPRLSVLCYVILCRYRPLLRTDHSSQGVPTMYLNKIKELAMCEAAKVLARL